MTEPRPELKTALHRAADRAGRRSGLRAIAFLAFALVAATGSALLLTRYMETRTAAVRVPTEPVVVADGDLPVGAELRAENLRAIPWPAASRPEGAFRDPKELEGKVVNVRVFRGEALLPAKLAGSEAGRGLSALLAPGMRAVAVRVDDVVGVAGFVHPGDNVDVIVTMRHDGASQATSSKVILQNIKVLAVGKELDGQAKRPDKVVPATVATLQVDAAASEHLALAATQGKILLSLRGALDAEMVETKGVSPAMLLAGARPAAPPPPAKRPARIARKEPAKQGEEMVEILRGDLFERRGFKQEARP